MFWKMTGLSAASPVDNILDKENFTLEELLEEEEIIQECKALNARLINFLRERTQVEQLLQYIVEEAPQDAEKKRIFKFPFIACEIFTCEVDIILRILVEDDELMNLLFSFLQPEHPHSTLLAGYFSKVVACLMMRKTDSLTNYIKSHQEIFSQLVDLIGITSIVEVLIRLIGADDNIYSNYNETMQWTEDTSILEMIVDKFSSSDCPEVHANAAEALCAIARSAPPALATKICSPSFIGRLFRHALEESRPKSALVHSLSVCMSLLDPKRLATSYQSFQSQFNHRSLATSKPETVDGMLESLGDLTKLLDVSPSETTLPTTYGSLQPPLGKHRLKIVDFISVLLTIGSEDAEKELIRHGSIKHILDLFFNYPFNNFLHHHVENIIGACLESKSTLLIEYILDDCNLVSEILSVEKQSTLSADPNKPTVTAEGRSAPRVGNIGHLSRIANKLIQYGNNNDTLQRHLQENNEWVEWHTNVLLKRIAVENVYQWACGRPNSLHDRTRDTDDEDFRDRDYDVAALANNLNQAFRYGIYNNDDVEEAHGSLDRDDEDVYFDDESAEVVISSLRLGDDQDSSSLFTNSNWFAFEDGQTAETSYPVAPLPYRLPTSDECDEVIIGDVEEVTASSEPYNSKESKNTVAAENSESMGSSSEETEKVPEWVEWRESTSTKEVDASPEFDSTKSQEVHAVTESTSSKSEEINESKEGVSIKEETAIENQAE